MRGDGGWVLYTTHLVETVQGSQLPQPHTPLGRVEAKIQPSHLGDFGLSGDRTGPSPHLCPWKDVFE